MNNRKNPKWLIAITVLVIAMLSMACGLSVNTPKLPQNFPGLPQQNPNPPSVITPQSNNAATPDVTGNGQAATPGASVRIPATGQEPGALAQPVTDAPKDLEAVYERSNPGVVSILVEVNQGGQSGSGAGSGFVLTDNGFVVTNHHVIEGASTIIVRFYNNADTPAQVVGDDPNADLAIIKVERMAQGAKPLPMGDSNNLRVGDSVVAIGNPFALGTSMSSGIISAVGRSIPSGFTPYNIPQAIQTDAAINPGNSGGPLINMNGEVIGINAQIRTAGSNGGNVGIGFAIPINILKQIYPDLIKTGSYAWPYLGVASPEQNPLALNANNVEAQQGALISDVSSGGPAEAAGLKNGDVVTQADNQKITSFDDLLGYIAYKRPGDKVNLTIVRGSQTQQIAVTLGQRPAGNQQQ